MIFTVVVNYLKNDQIKVIFKSLSLFKLKPWLAVCHVCCYWKKSTHTKNPNLTGIDGEAIDVLLGYNTQTKK